MTAPYRPDNPFAPQRQRSEVTTLPAGSEPAFRDWLTRNQVTDLDHPDSHYDYRGAFRAGVNRDAASGHWPDRFKQHGHPTFSVESEYSAGSTDGGRWAGDSFVARPTAPQRPDQPSENPFGASRYRPDNPFAEQPEPMTAAPLEARPPAPPLDFGQPQRAAADVTFARPTPVQRPERPLPPPTPEEEVPAYQRPGVPIYDRFGEQRGTRPTPSTEPGIYATAPPSFVDRLVERVREKYRYKSAAPGAPSALPRGERDVQRAISQALIYGERQGQSPEEIQRTLDQDIVDIQADEGKWQNQVATMLADFVDPTMLAGGVVGERAAITAIEGAASRGIPWAMRVERLMQTPEGAPLVRRLIARATHGVATGGAANVGFQVAGAAEEGRVPSPKELAYTFAVGTALAPGLEVGGALAAAPFRGGRPMPPPAARPDLEGFMGTGAKSMTPDDVAAVRILGREEAGPTAARPGLRQRIANVIDPERAQRVQALEHELRGAQRAAETDPMTGLGNQAAFQRARTTADADPGTEVVAFDLNNLKAVNDVQGHEAGNALIQRAGAALQEAGARGFRTGGDELVAIVPRGQGAAVRQAVERSVGETSVALPDGRTVSASVSGNVGPTFAEADAGLQSAKQARKGGASYRGATPPPSNIVRMPTAEIQADPARFQFKALGSEGVSGELKGVTRFNEQLAGVVSVWRDPADGSVYVVNGHHRLELAKRMGQRDLNVQFIDAPTAEAARAEGAVINIAEGRGTAVDAAKVMRDMGATPADLLEQRGVSLRGEVARDGLALSKLAPDVFDQVATAQVPQGWGVAIGSLVDDPVLQREALAAVRGSGKRLTQAEVTEVARQVRDAGTEGVNQETLFGSETERRGLFVQRAQLAAAVKKRLAGDKRLFGYVAKEGRAEELSRAGGTQIDVEAARGLAEGSARSEEVFDRLYTRSGPLADLMSEGARRIARGEKPSSVIADIYPAIGDAVGRELEARGARPGAVERAVPAGERSLADEIPGAAEERVGTSQDPAQAGLLSPARPSRARPLQGTESPAAASGPGRPVEPRTEAGAPGRPSLALTPEPEGPAQQGMFGAKEGTAAARNLAQTEAAARGELETLRQRFAAERDPARKSALAAQIAERQKLLNRGGAISAEELRTRAAAESPEPVSTGPDQLALLSPDLPASYMSRLKQAGAKVPSAAEQAEVKTLMEISRGFAEALGLPMRQGRFNAGLRRAVGVFKPHEEVGRVTRLDKLDTVSHEAGHFISKKYLRNPTTVRGGRGARLPKEAARELVQMGRDLYGSRKPVSGYGEEGIAEWVSFYVTEPHTLAQKAPTFTAWMDGVLAQEPMLRAAMDQARADFATYQRVPEAARVDTGISVGERQRFAPTMRDYMRVVADDSYDVRWAVEQLGKPRSAAEDAGVLARLTRGAFGEAHEWLERGVLKAGTVEERLNPGIAETFGPLVRAGRAQELRRYLHGESALERWSNGIDPGTTRADAQAMVDLYGKDPEIRAAAEAAWQHSLALLEAKRAVGLIDDVQFKQIAAKNQRRVGFYRIFEPEETAGRRGGGQGGLASSGIKSQTGSARRSVDPIEAILRDTYDTAKKVRAHEAKRALVEQALRTESGGKIVEEVPAPLRPVSIPIEKLEQQLADLGIVYEGIDQKTGQAFTARIGGPGGAQIDALLQAFTEARTAGGAEAKDLVFPMLMKGELRWFAVKDAKLYDALVGLGPQELDIWRRVLSFPKRALQTGATTTLEFAFGNVSKDVFSASIFSKASWRPPLWRHLEGLYHTLRHDPVYQRFRLHGGDQATMGGVDRGTAQLEARRLFGYFRTLKQAWLDRQQAWSRASVGEKGLYALSDVGQVVLSPFEALRTVKEWSETMGRVGEYAAVERQALRRGAEPVAAAKEAALGARDVAIDFQQLGSATREVNHIVAFFGAWLRGWAQLGRGLKTRPHIVIPRIVAEVTVPSLALYYLQRKDPVYNKMAAWKRDLFWVYVQRGDDRGEGWDNYGSGKVEHIWMFPKPFELGILFGTLPERMAEWHDRHDAMQADRMGDALKRMAPPWIPTAAVPLIENYADRSTFRDRPIVPRGRSDLDPAEQSAPQTGETARLLGKALGYSPAKIENLVRGWSGGAGMYGLSATNAVVRLYRAAEGLPPLKAPRAAPTDEDPLLHVPGLKRFLSRLPAEDSESVERLYQDFERAERHRQTWRAMLKEGRRPEASQYLEQHRDDILSVATAEEAGKGRHGALREAYQQMQDLQQAKRALTEAAVPGGRERAIEVMRRLGGTMRERTP